MGRQNKHTYRSPEWRKKTHSRQNTWKEENMRLDGKTSFKLL